VEIQDENGNTIPGFSFADCKAVTGDAVENAVHWNKGQWRELHGRTVRLKFRLDKARVYALLQK
jgi:hypothetical protein